MKEFIKKNIKFIIVMLIIIILGIYGITYAISIANRELTNINVTTGNMGVSITYDNGSDENIGGIIMPIEDSLVSYNSTDTRIIKSKFYISSTNNNVNNVIYDIVIRDIEADCEIKKTNFKWRLYKNSNLLTEGNMSPTFDTMENNRLVLTNTQQDLTTTSVGYVLVIWLSESCTGDIKTCTANQNQNAYLNKQFSGKIKIELSSKNKKVISRKTASETSCE